MISSYKSITARVCSKDRDKHNPFVEYHDLQNMEVCDPKIKLE